MSPFRILAAALALFIGLQALPAVAADVTTGSGDPVYTIQNPPAFVMIGDLLIARPLLIAATVIGTGLFVIAAPLRRQAATLGQQARRWWWIRARQPSFVVWVARATGTASSSEGVIKPCW